MATKKNCISNMLKEEKYWVKGYYIRNKYDDPDNVVYTCYCLIGAIQAQVGTKYNPHGEPNRRWLYLINKLYKAIPKKFQRKLNPKHLIDKSDCIISYNDNEKTTFKSIRNTLRKAGL